MNAFNKFKNYDVIFILILLLLLCGQFIYLKVGLEVDESFYLVNAESILAGSLTQHDSWGIGIYPAFYCILSFILFIFGKSVTIPRIILYMINGLNAIIIFKIGSDLFNEKVGKVASVLFLIAVLIPKFENYFVLIEPFMLFFGLIGIYFFLKSENNVSLVISGFFFSIAALCKTVGLFYVAVAGLFYIFNLRNSENQNKEYIVSSIKKMSLVTFGFMIPITIGYLYFSHIGSISTYFLFPAIKFTSTREQQQFNIESLIRLFLSYSILWIFALMTMFVFGFKYISGKYSKQTLFIIISFLIFLYPLSSRQYGHYVIPVLPHASILASIFIVSNFPKIKLGSVKKSYIIKDYLRIFAFICILGLIVSCLIYDIQYINRTLNNGKNTYQEQLETSSYIKSHTSENDSIFVLGYEPSVYYLSDRKPLTSILIFDVYRYNEKLENEIINKLKTDDVYVIKAPFYDTNYFVNLSSYVDTNYEPEKSIGEFQICKKRDSISEFRIMA